jgi:hypothetical protein
VVSKIDVSERSYLVYKYRSWFNNSCARNKIKVMTIKQRSLRSQIIIPLSLNTVKMTCGCKLLMQAGAVLKVNVQNLFESGYYRLKKFNRNDQLAYT